MGRERMIHDYSLAEIASLSGSSVSTAYAGLKISGFSTDSRRISPGDIFIALKGENFDGRDFIREAAERGAHAALVPGDVKSSPVPCIITADIYGALAGIAADIRCRCNIPVICITGSNGKTSVKDILGSMLSRKYRVLKSERSYNNLLGICLTLFRLDAEHEIAVLEVGTNKKGEISFLSGILRPDVCIINNISYGHIGAFETLNAVLEEKISMLGSMEPGALAVLNGDDRLLQGVRPRNVRTEYFGKSSGSDIRISDISKQEHGYSFKINGESYRIQASGEHNIMNAAAACAVAGHFGVEYRDIKKTMKEHTLPPMRLTRERYGNIMFINDAYNANPGSFSAALEVLSGEVSGGLKCVVAGDMLELGEISSELHFGTGRLIAHKGFDLLVVLGKEARHIAEGAVSAGMRPESVKEVSSHMEAAQRLAEIGESGAVVLVKGSRKSKMEEVIKCFTSCYIR
jgi:UDP-N-acetylmuramoyl-tripeptide--D-alanyl-D-alanine ligase